MKISIQVKMSSEPELKLKKRICKHVKEPLDVKMEQNVKM